MNNSIFLAFIALVTLSIYSCSSGTQTDDTTTTEADVVTEEAAADTEILPVVNADTTAAVLQRHLDAFGANDLAAIVADYDENATVKTPDSTYNGTEQISGLIAGLFQNFPTGGTEFSLDTTVINYAVAYIEWKAKSATMNVTFGADSFIVTDGKIQYQSIVLEVGELDAVESAVEEGESNTGG